MYSALESVILFSVSWKSKNTRMCRIITRACFNPEMPDQRIKSLFGALSSDNNQQKQKTMDDTSPKIPNKEMEQTEQWQSRWERYNFN